MKHRIPLSFIAGILMVFLPLFTASPLHAGYLGGEITWECTPQGNFRFILKLLRDCGAPGTLNDTLWITSNYPGYDSLGMVRVAVNDLTPHCDCPAGAAPNCATATQPGTGAMKEYIYTSNAFFPNGVPLTGVPPVTGYYFAFEGCCRVPTANLTPGNSNFAIRSVMYPYLNTPINTCFDNLHSYRELPYVVTCAGTETWYLPHAYDNELDSIFWEWTPPLLNTTTPVTAYNPGYSYDSPLPSATHHPNNTPATLGLITGDIAFTSHTPGLFFTAVTVSTYKMHIKVAETIKEIPVFVLSCPTPNEPPVITIDGQPVPKYITDTVYAGTLISFTIAATDSGLCQGGSSPMQSVSLTATGEHLSDPLFGGFCRFMPCATMSPVVSLGNPLSGSPTVQSTFSWQTGPQHLPDFTYHCPNCSWVRHYDFYFTASDNVCPAPAKKSMHYRVVLIPKPKVSPPPVVCADVLANGDVTLSWHSPEDPLGLFKGYFLSTATNMAGPFTAIDSLFNIGISTANHAGANAHNQPRYYMLRVRNDSVAGAPVPALPFDTISTLFVKVTAYVAANDIALLEWSPLRTTPLPGQTPPYTVHREYPAGTWSVAGTTTALAWSDTLPPGDKVVRYKISTADTVITATGPVACLSNSNITELKIFVGIGEQDPEGFSLGQNIPNPAPQSTVIPFHLPEPGNVTLILFDISGRVMEYRSLEGLAGENTILLDLSGLAAGIYSYTLHFQGAIKRKILVVK